MMSPNILAENSQGEAWLCSVIILSSRYLHSAACSQQRALSSAMGPKAFTKYITNRSSVLECPSTANTPIHTKSFPSERDSSRYIALSASPKHKKIPSPHSHASSFQHYAARSHSRRHASQHHLQHQGPPHSPQRHNNRSVRPRTELRDL